MILGERIVVKCVKCGRELDYTIKFCYECGKEVILGEGDFSMPEYSMKDRKSIIELFNNAKKKESLAK